MDFEVSTIQASFTRWKCIEATVYLCKVTHFSDLSHRWKLDNKILKNKDGIWKSFEKWNFTPKNDSNLIYIENISEGKVLGVTNDNKIILEEYEQDKPGQLWKKEAELDGYFTLTNSEVAIVCNREDNDKEVCKEMARVITAISSSGLEIKFIGNLNLEPSLII